MTHKSSLSICALLFLSCFAIQAEETTETEASAVVTKDAEESQAIIEQVDASEKDSSNTVKTWIPSAE